MAADLITNLPGGVCRLTGVVPIEEGTLRLKLKILVDGAAADLSGHTTDSAFLMDRPGGTVLATLTIAVTATGDVTITSAALPKTLADSRRFPQGRPAILQVRMKDTTGSAYYLVAPSEVRIRQAIEAGS